MNPDKFVNQIISDLDSIGKNLVKVIDMEILLAEILARQDGPWTMRYPLYIRKLEDIRAKLCC